MKTVKNEFANYVGVLLGKKWFAMQQAKKPPKHGEPAVSMKKRISKNARNRKNET